MIGKIVDLFGFVYFKNGASVKSGFSFLRKFDRSEREAYNHVS